MKINTDLEDAREFVIPEPRQTQGPRSERRWEQLELLVGRRPGPLFLLVRPNPGPLGKMGCHQQSCQKDPAGMEGCLKLKPKVRYRGNRSQG